MVNMRIHCNRYATVGWAVLTMSVVVNPAATEKVNITS